MSLNQLIDPKPKPWLKITAGSVDVPLLGSLSNLFTVNGATTSLRRCEVNKYGKVYTFAFHVTLTAATVGQLATITINAPVGLAVIPGYKAIDINLKQVAPVFKHTDATGTALGLEAIQNEPNFRLVAAGTNVPYAWVAGDANLDFSCTMQVVSA
jgi:hypothetical protein